MRNIAKLSGVLIAGLTLSVAALPVASDAACNKRTNGTIIGALGGGLLGHTIAGRGSHTEGTLIGATAGAVVGNQVSKCHRSHSRAYYRRHSAPPRAAYAPSRYDSRYDRYDTYAANNCRYETRAFYDARGQVVYQPTRVCGRY
jgi:uncharacterized protein YcfJ